MGCCFCLVVKSCPTLWDSMDYSPPGSSVHGLLQARILEWVAIPFSRGFSRPRDQTRISWDSCTAGRFFTIWTRYVKCCRVKQGLPWWLRGQSVCLQCRRPTFDPWVGKIPWRRKWQPTPVFLPGEVHGQRSLVGHSPWGHKELDSTEWLMCYWWQSCAASPSRVVVNR